MNRQQYIVNGWKGTRGGICHAIHRYSEANNKDMKNYDNTKKSSYLMYLDANSLNGWGMSQNLPVNDFKWKKKSFIDLIKSSWKIIMKILIKDIFLK